MSDARLLVNRLKDHDNCADNVISQTQALLKRMEAMKQYQDDLNELNDIARHRPRANLIMGLLQENNQIRELQQENQELRSSLEEHQSAIELIMSKYREQVARLMMANKLDQGAMQKSDHSKEVEEKIDKICEMAVIMQEAIRLDEERSASENKIIAQLKFENQTLRELLKISKDSGSLQYIPRVEQETQTIDDLSDVDTTEDECTRSVIFRGPEQLTDKTDTSSQKLQSVDSDLSQTETSEDLCDTDTDSCNDTVIERST